MTQVYDAFDYPIHAGDLLRFPGKVDEYRVAVKSNGGEWPLKIVPPSHLEPSVRDDTGIVSLCDQLASRCEIVAGCGTSSHKKRARRLNAAEVMTLLDDVNWDTPDETPKPVIHGRWGGDEVSVRVDGDNSVVTSDGDVMAFDAYVIKKLNERP